MIRIIITMICLCAGSLFGSPAQADTNPWLEDNRFKLSLGTFLIDYDSEFRISNDKGIGTQLSFEEHLGLEDSRTVARLSGHYRFTARHRVEFSYVDLSRDGKATTTFPIIIDDTFYRTGTKLKTDFDYRVFKLAYGFSFYQTERTEVSLSAGGYIFDANLKITPNEGEQENESGTAPFPMFGLHLNHRFSDRLMLIAGYEYFTIDKNDIEGELIDVLIALEYRTSSRFGLGIGYNDVNISAEDTDDNDDFDYEYDGILAYLSYSF